MHEESGRSAEGFSEAILGGFGEGAGDEWLVKIDCPTCGLQETVWVTGRGGRVPRAEDAYPPLCPCCESFAEPQPRVISIEKLVNGHLVLPAGGHEIPHWWPSFLPAGGHESPHQQIGWFVVC